MILSLLKDCIGEGCKNEYLYMSLSDAVLDCVDCHGTPAQNLEEAHEVMERCGLRRGRYGQGK